MNATKTVPRYILTNTHGTAGVLEETQLGTRVSQQRTRRQPQLLQGQEARIDNDGVAAFHHHGPGIQPESVAGCHRHGAQWVIPTVPAHHMLIPRGARVGGYGGGMLYHRRSCRTHERSRIAGLHQFEPRGDRGPDRQPTNGQWLAIYQPQVEIDPLSGKHARRGKTAFAGHSLKRPATPRPRHRRNHQYHGERRRHDNQTYPRCRQEQAGHAHQPKYREENAFRMRVPFPPRLHGI
ncbi:MAG: hypothetical protein BWY79_00940 [Actinobacteria bacterium ADurb.Bin444]|nr:MAG: hypothetical protein BWY79_00940 [Actinobacteria bacterium ADurb.Bin444]